MFVTATHKITTSSTRPRRVARGVTVVWNEDLEVYVITEPLKEKYKWTLIFLTWCQIAICVTLITVMLGYSRNPLS